MGAVISMPQIVKKQQNEKEWDGQRPQACWSPVPKFSDVADDSGPLHFTHGIWIQIIVLASSCMNYD